MQSVLVLGANGYLGSHICHTLKQKGYYVIGVGRSNDHNLTIDKYIQLNVADKNAIGVLANQECDIVIDLVSYILPNDSSTEMNQVRVALKHYPELLKICFIDKQYIFISSGGTVYGDAKSPCTEDSKLNPLTPYALQKVIQEEIIQKELKKYQILRVSNPYGGNQKVKHGVGFIAYVANCLENNNTIKLTVPETTVRDYIEIDDLIKTVMFFTTEKITSSILNVSSGFGASLEMIIEHYANKKSKIAKIERPTLQNELSGYISYNVLNNQKMIALTNIKPKIILGD